MPSIRSNGRLGAARRRATFIALAPLGAALMCSAAIARPRPTPTPALLIPSAMSATSPEPSSSATAVDPAITARAKEWLHRLQTGNVDRSQLDTRMNGILTDQKIAQVAAQLGPLGEPTHFTLLRRLQNKTGIAYVYGATFKAHPAMWVFALDSTSKINGLVIRPLDAVGPAPASTRPVKLLP